MAYFIAALFGGFFAFNALATPKKAARTVESSLRKMFPGAQVKAEIEGKRGRDVLKGRFKSARLSMSNFSFGEGAGLGVQVVPSASSQGRIGRFEMSLRDFGAQGFRVSALDLSIDNVLLDWKALRKSSQLKLVSPPASDTTTPRTSGRARLVLGQAALEGFVRTRFPDLGKSRVTLSNGRMISVAGAREFLGASFPFELSGRLEVRDGRALELRDPQVLAAGVPLAPALAAPLLKNLGTLYELDPVGRWPLAMRVTSLKVETVAGAPSLVLDATIALKPGE
jgi:hypothetical protein